MNDYITNEINYSDQLFDKNDKLFKKYLFKSNLYAEYGCGQSTHWVLKNTSAKILSVDTSLDWVDRIKKLNVYDSNRIKLKHVDLGKVKSWGFPKDYKKRNYFSEYTNWIWTQTVSPDVILIDGRFRVCCLFTSLKFAKEGAIILFDDYLNRPNYHIVENYLSIHEKYGRQVAFKVPKKKEIDYEMIEKEIINFRHVFD